MSRTAAGIDWIGAVIAIASPAIATLCCAALERWLPESSLVLLYLLGISAAASWSIAAGWASALLSTAAFDFFLVEPRYTFAVLDRKYLFTFGVMLTVGMVIGVLSSRLRVQSQKKQEAETRARIEQMRADLLSSMQHDLRTPLASVEGAAEVLLNQADLSAKSSEMAEIIHSESTRLGRLLSNLLDMTRIQGIVELNLDWYDFDELAANAAARAESLFLLPVQVVRASEIPLVRIDGILIEQVFTNLLENAAKHGGENVRVRITIGGMKGGVFAEVEDSGRGIFISNGESVFDRFVSSDKGGTGLGLAICRAAVEAQGGRISVSKSDLGGAKFRFEIPGVANV